MWESYKLDPYVQKFAEQISSFEEKIDDLLLIDDQICNEVRLLDTCNYSFKDFKEIIGQ